MLIEPLAVAAFLVVVVNRLVAGLVTPIFVKFKLDKFWLMYIAWLFGGVIVFLSGVNLFIDYLPDPLTGQVLTSLVAGGGANLLYDVFKPAPDGVG